MRVEEGVPLSRLTTIGTGGPAAAFARPSSLEELRRRLPGQTNASLVAVVGLGSNLLAADAGVDALVLRLAGDLAVVRSEGERLIAGGGATNAVYLHERAPPGSAASSFACVRSQARRGGVRMNAGAYGSDWSQILLRAHVVAADGDGWLTLAELGLSYRHSELRPGQVVAEVEYRPCRGRRSRSRRPCAT